MTDIIQNYRINRDLCIAREQMVWVNESEATIGDCLIEIEKGDRYRWKLEKAGKRLSSDEEKDKHAAKEAALKAYVFHLLNIK